MKSPDGPMDFVYSEHNHAKILKEFLNKALNR